MPSTPHETQMSTMSLVNNPSDVEIKEAPSTAGRREQQIRSNVLAALGRPGRLLKVAVLPLWGNKVRVNVWTGEESGNAIPNSYFVTADERGNILRSEPPIQKQY
jgi:hypothetical protein